MERSLLCLRDEHLVTRLAPAHTPVSAIPVVTVVFMVTIVPMVTVFHMVTIVSMVTIVPIVPLMVPSVAGVVAALAGAPVVQHQVGQGVAITFILAILWILAMAIVLAIIVILMVITVMTGTISHITRHRTAAHTSHCGLWGGPATLVILDISVIYLSSKLLV